MYSSYINPLLFQSNKCNFESPIVLLPQSVILHLQCTNSEAGLSITLYNIDKYPIKELCFKGFELVKNWHNGNLNTCLNMVELITDKVDLPAMDELYVSFSVKDGLVISREILLEYD